MRSESVTYAAIEESQGTDARARTESADASGARRKDAVIVALRAWHARTKNVSRAIARAGIAKSSYHEWLCGSRSMPAWALRALVRATDDDRLLRESMGLADLGIAVTRTARADPHGARSVLEIAAAMSFDSAAFGQMIVSALIDRHPDPQCIADLDHQIDRIVGDAISAKAQIRKGKP